MPWCEQAADVSLLQVDWQATGHLHKNLSIGSAEVLSGPPIPNLNINNPVLNWYATGIISLLSGFVDAEGNPLLDAEAELQATTVIVVISVLATLLCFTVFLLASFAPPSVGPDPSKEGESGAHSPSKQLCPELVTPTGGELLTLPAWVFSPKQEGEPIWKDQFVEFCDLEGNPRLRMEVQITIDGNEHVILKDAYDNRIFAFCALPVGNTKAPLRIHRGDGELFALLGKVPEHGGFALAGCSTSQRYLPVPSRMGCPAMRVTTERNDGFVALAEGPIVRLGGGVDAGLVLLGLVALRRQEAMAQAPLEQAQRIVASAFGPPQDDTEMTLDEVTMTLDEVTGSNGSNVDEV